MAADCCAVGTVSIWSLATEALSYTEPVTIQVTGSVNVAVAPVASKLTVQFTVDPDTVQPAGVEDNTAPAGSVSITTT